MTPYLTASIKVLLFFQESVRILRFIFMLYRYYQVRFKLNSTLVTPLSLSCGFSIHQSTLFVKYFRHILVFLCILHKSTIKISGKRIHPCRHKLVFEFTEKAALLFFCNSITVINIVSRFVFNRCIKLFEKLFLSCVEVFGNINDNFNKLIASAST